MGLDMYLEGRKYLMSNYDDPDKDEKEDGFPVREKGLSLGYWRKHPNLHGYIVQTFAEGRDECQDIELDVPKLKAIIAAVEKKELPHTTGFFFGESDGSEDEETLAILKKAIDWLDRVCVKHDDCRSNREMAIECTRAEEKRAGRESYRNVVYRASW